jgi:hypothetical protein
MEKVPFAIVLEGVSARWQINVLQVLAAPANAQVAVEGHRTIDATAFLLSQDRARHLATQIIEILGSENANSGRR